MIQYNMTLEDFFTLTEMRDGLATLARVEELVSVMQKQNDCTANNVDDAGRQWSTVASIVAASGNMDCLNHFIHLNGLWFLNHWLEEAHKWSDDATDSSFEDLINALLRALERIPVDSNMANASGIGTTVKQLHGHRNHNVQERVNMLLDKWSQSRDNDMDCKDVEKNCNNELKPSGDTSVVGESVLGVSPAEERAGEGSCGVESASIVLHQSTASKSFDCLQVDSSKDMEISIPIESSPQPISNSVDLNVISGDTNLIGSTHLSNTCPESQPLPGDSALCSAAERTSTGTSSPQIVRDRIFNDCSFSPENVSSDLKDMDVDAKKVLSACDKSCQEENLIFSPSSGLTASPLHEHKSVPELAVTCDLKGSDMFCHGENIPVSPSAPKDHCSNSDLMVRERFKSSIPIYSSKTAANADLMDLMGNGSEMGLQSEEIDALEVARQVAIQVEREVVDSREPFSSPEGNSEGDAMVCHSPTSTENEHDQPKFGQVGEDESLTREDLSDDTSSQKSESSKMLDNDIISRGLGQELESLKSVSVCQDSVVNTMKSRCDFDLNENVCTEEIDCTTVLVSNRLINLSVPIAVAASKGTPGLPVTPIRFEGELGWRGSAATSAFRPASTRRNSEGETVSGPKQKPNVLDFDLNMADIEEDIAVDTPLRKQHPIVYEIPSCGSSLEVSSRRVERMKLDLNCAGDEDAGSVRPSSWRLHHQNGDNSPSHASSSSSRHPLMRDIDLNDTPLSDARGSRASSRSSTNEMTTFGSLKLHDSVVSIMGSRFSVRNKEPYYPAPQAFANGSGMEPSIGARLSGAYSHLPPPALYGHSGLGVGPTMPFLPAAYGPESFPYMIDSRGAAVVPQLLGTSSGMNGAPNSRLPLLFGVGGAPSGASSDGFSRPSLDLNSGFMPMERVSREVGSYKQVFIQGHGGLLEEQMKSASQTVGSLMALKRKEPDCGWEPYSISYKQATSWL